MSDSNKPSSSSSAAQKTERKNDKNKNRDAQIVDPELDIKSAHFNPLKALYASSVHVPVENVPIYNNIAHYESAMKMRQQQHSPGDGASVRAAPKMPTKPYRQAVELHQRRFLPHQEMVKGRGKNARQTRNLLSKMNSDKLMGPLNVLKDWKVQRQRIKIFTRNVTTINGYVTGFIEAFDKHWNIVLSNVHEVWKRKKFHYSPKAVMQPMPSPSVADNDNDDDNNNDGNNDNRHDDELFTKCIQRLKMLNITQPTIAVKSLNRKLVECSRNVPKLLIRGEQIATIILDQQTTNKPETEISSISVKV